MGRVGGAKNTVTRCLWQAGVEVDEVLLTNTTMMKNTLFTVPTRQIKIAHRPISVTPTRQTIAARSTCRVLAAVQSGRHGYTSETVLAAVCREHKQGTLNRYGFGT